MVIDGIFKDFKSKRGKRNRGALATLNLPSECLFMVNRASDRLGAIS